MVKPPCGSARPAQHAAHLPTHGGGAEHPAAREHCALATIGALAARREIASRGMETTLSQRLTGTPASPEASDALPGTPLPHAEKRARWALAGFLGPGTPRDRGRRAPCRSPKPLGLLARPARRPHGPLRRAQFPVPSPIGHGLGHFESNGERTAQDWLRAQAAGDIWSPAFAFSWFPAFGRSAHERDGVSRPRTG
jgi:hypothetical protein